MTTTAAGESGSESELDRARVAHRLRLAVGRTARRLRQRAGEELTPSQAAILDTLARQESLTPARLAELERVSRPTLTRLIAKLKEQGLVECTPNPEDGRSYSIAISERGETLRDVRRARKAAFLDELLEDASPEELELLEHASDVLLRLLEGRPA